MVAEIAALGLRLLKELLRLNQSVELIFSEHAIVVMNCIVTIASNKAGESPHGGASGCC